MLPYFVPVGLLFSAVAFLVSQLRFWLPIDLVAVLVVAVQVVLSGGLHWDGWADVWDAWAGPPDRRQEILRDSRLGAIGAGALVVLGLGLLWGTRDALVINPWAVWLAPVVGRAVMTAVVQTPRPLAGSRLLEAARTSSPAWSAGSQAALALVVAGVLHGTGGMVDAAQAGIFSAVFAIWVIRWLGGVNGDVAGATGLLAEVAVIWGGTWR